MSKPEDFFVHLKEFSHNKLFDDVQQLWDPIKKLDGYLKDFLKGLGPDCKRLTSMEGLSFMDDGSKPHGISATERIEFADPVYFEKVGILFGKGTVIEPTAIIKGPCVIGDHCEVRQGAYIRDSVIVGDRCVIGHNTEVKHSIIMNHTEAGHFNYIGDSILGSYVNLGAGSRLANLEFRTSGEKQEGEMHPILLNPGTGETDTGMEKLGSVLGDFVEIGCNAVLSPGCLVGKDTWVYPNLTLPKGYYPPGQFILPQDKKPRLQDRNIPKNP